MLKHLFTSEGVPEEPQKCVIINQSSGKFFEVYSYDAFIFNYLFDYKIIQAGKTYKFIRTDDSLEDNYESISEGYHIKLYIEEKIHM